MPNIDLHAHSNFSDGSNSPEELVALAEALDLAALALTDHNTVAGLPDFMKAAAGSTVEAIGGAEFSTDFGEHEVHMVGLFIEPAAYEKVKEFVLPLALRKIEANRELEKALQKAGYDISIDEMLQAKPGAGQVNRADFAAELKRKGYMDFSEAFSSVLAKQKDGGLYREPRRLDAMETIEFIRSIDAVPVLAHPYLSFKPNEVEVFLRQAVGRGLGGMEVFYSTYDEQTTVLAEQMARKYGLAFSGGSDYHGSRKPDTHLGSGKGNLAIPAELLPALRNA